MLKLRESLSGKHALKRKSRMWLHNLLFSASKVTKGQSIQSHRGLFEEIRCVNHESPRPCNQKSGIESGLSVEDLWRISCLMV